MWAWSQTTIWSDNDFATGKTSTASNLTLSSGVYQTNSSNQATWTSTSIDISSYINVSIDLIANSSQNLETTGKQSNRDEMSISYTIDGTSTTAVTKKGNVDTDYNPGITGLNGNTLTITVTMKNNGGSEWHSIKDVNVEGTLCGGIGNPSVSSIGFSTARFSADYCVNGTTDKGFVYSSSNSTPTVSDTKVSGGSANENFGIDITGLSQSTTYYVRTYAYDGSSYTYSSQTASFNTNTCVIGTPTTSLITYETARISVPFCSQSFTSKGIVYGTSSNPTGNITQSVNSDNSDFVIDLSSLNPNTTYYVRAYSYNGSAYTYATETTFTTESCDIGTPVVSDVSATSFNISVPFCTTGTITEKGFVLNTGGNPTVADTKITEGTTTVEDFTVSASSLTAGTTYYIKSYYIKSGTTYYGDQITATTANAFYPIIISEYGCNGNDKYIEIFNGCASSINLSNYTLVTFINGANRNSGTVYGLQLPNYTLDAGEVYVIVNSNSSSTYTAKADLSTTDNALNFNGADAVAIFENTNGGMAISSGEVIDFGGTIMIDLFGEIGSNTNWQYQGNNRSSNSSFGRQKNQIGAQSVNYNNFDITDQWELFNLSPDSLGQHFNRVNTSNVSASGNLTLSNLVAKTTDMTLNGNLIVKEKLSLSDADIDCGSHNVVTNSSTLSHGNSSSYIKISGDGKLKNTVQNNNTNIINPIGRNPYLPVIINCVDCDGVEFDFGVKVNVYENPTTQTTQITSSSIGETWEITPSATFTSAITITVQWPSTSELTSFDRTNSMLSYWQSGTSSQWQKPSSTSSAQNGSEGSSYTQTITLSGMIGGDTYYFGVGSNGSALPVEFGELTASLVGGQAQIEWVTLMEENNDYFEVQRSQDMINWEVVDVVAGAGTTFETNYYVSYDSSPLNGMSFYRIKQVDYNGEFDYSKAVSVETAASVEIALYPNPTLDFVNINSTERVNLVQVYNTAGVLMLNTDFSSNRIDLKGLTAGVYTVVVSGNFGTKQFRLLKQ